ncbi:hypothetical protein SIL87_18790 [Acidiphilium acidophilum]|uniref:Uncharacterized protein n=2 Tax=Acidiphilium acidophilum TaxID=76588 RepID=A0AAW9DUR2_ACIAO|nr:hypothetical protein [Acidiphilium acidophilum]
MGRRLAEMHATLATPGTAPAFAPEPASEADARGWADAARHQLEAAFAALERARPAASAATTALIDEVVAARGALEAALPKLAAAGSGTLKTRIHGDFHLGQILAAQGDAYLIDFEGEPAKSITQRRAKASALRDVAGLLRSFDYAGASVSRAVPVSTDRAAERSNSMLQRFVTDASAAFIEAYRAVAGAAEHKWVSDEAWEDLLRLFLIEKSAYEICYESANRPGWLAIPLGGLAAITRQITGGDHASA